MKNTRTDIIHTFGIIEESNDCRYRRSKYIVSCYSSSDNSICSEIGKTILESRKGSVVDSAIAVALCLGVVSPQTSGLGGGFFMTVYVDRKMYSLNAVEKAPAGASNDTYLKDYGAPRRG